MKKLLALLCLSLSLLVGCGSPETEAVKEPVALVKLMSAVTGDLPEVIQGYGSIEFAPSGKRTLNAEIDARVIEVNAMAGDLVEIDQVLVRLTPSSAGTTEVTRARRDAANAQASAERIRRLRADGLASDADVEAGDTSARDSLEQALSLEARSGTTLTLRAPIDGVVAAILVDPGDLIPPGAPIVQLASPGAVQARIGIEVVDATLLAVGAPVSLRSLNNRSSQTDTTIHMLDTRINPVTRMTSALVSIPLGHGFYPGEAVRADITAGTRAGVVIVPRAAVFNDETGSYSFVAQNDIARLTRVEVGLTSGEYTEIRTGITAGDDVVINGAATLTDGMKIRTQALGAKP